MAQTSPFYSKLVGSRPSFGSRFSLWLAADHVLLVDANMITERYQRVWLRDVQGFLVRESRQAGWVIGVGSVFTLLFGVHALTFADAELKPLYWTLFGVSLLILLFGLFGARNCHFYAVTAVQCSEWPNVARRAKVRKLLARLEPLIREAQRDTVQAAPSVSVADRAPNVTPPDVSPEP